MGDGQLDYLLVSSILARNLNKLRWLFSATQHDGSKGRRSVQNRPTQSTTRTLQTQIHAGLSSAHGVSSLLWKEGSLWKHTVSSSICILFGVNGADCNRKMADNAVFFVKDITKKKKNGAWRAIVILKYAENVISSRSHGYKAHISFPVMVLTQKIVGAGSISI